MLCVLCVYTIHANLSETGKKQRLFFETQKEALTAAEQIKTRKANFGNTLATLSPARISEAAESFKLLDAQSSRFSLLEVVRMHLEHESSRNASVSFEEMFDLYIKARSHKTPGHLKKLRNCKERFPKLAPRLVCDIKPEDLEPVLNKLKPAMRNAEMRYLSSVFKYGIQKGKLFENPIHRLDKAEIDRKEVETVPVVLVEKMLLYSLQNDIELLPFLVLGFFCGIRPNGELEKVQWKDVHVEEREVVIRSTVSKIKRKRSIQLSDNAVEWLKRFLEQRHPRPAEKIVPFSFGVLRGKREALWEAVTEGSLKWIHQGMRHTFCSCHLAKHKNINELVLQTGHSSPTIMWESYHRGIHKEEAERFWSIFPPKQEETKIVAFPAAS